MRGRWEAPLPRGYPPAAHLVEESLAEVLHGALELVALGLPLLIAPHVLGRGALPGGGPSVVVHVVEPASGVCAFLPAANIKLRMNTVTASPLRSNAREISGWLARRRVRKGLVWGLAQEFSSSGKAQPGGLQSRRLLGLRCS